MTDPPLPTLTDLPASDAVRVEQVCRRFEQAWRAGPPSPRLEDYLPEIAGPAQVSLLCELLLRELIYRCQAGDMPLLAEYLDRFPAHEELLRRVFRHATLPEEPGPVTKREEIAHYLPAAAAAGEQGRPVGSIDEDQSPTPPRQPASLCNLLTRAWGHRAQPALDLYVARVGADAHPTLVRHLLATEVQRRRFAGETPRLGEYLERFPQFASLIRHVFRELTPDLPQETMKPSAESDRSTPPMLGHYRLLEKLGKGGMGAVYKAEHANLKRLVAIKLLPEESLHHPQSVSRFYREMEAIGRLDHPHVIRATDAGEAAGRHFLVMEFVDGMDLGRVVQQQGWLRIPDACELVRQAALGLQYVHEQGLVHRDVKPSNLLLTTRGQVKVLDLGLALLWGDRPPGGDLTSSGQAMGTIDYMAPEQGIDSHGVDIRADIYSLGCTLYKLLTGVVPYGAPQYHSTAEKFRAHALAPIPSVTDKRPEVPAEVAAVVTRMLAKTPEERYATPGEVARALESHVSGADLNCLGASPPSEARERDDRLLDRPVSGSAETNVRAGLTPPLHADPPVRRRSRLASLVALGIGVLGISATILTIVPLWQRPARGPVETNSQATLQLTLPEEPRPHTWHNALLHPPQALLWPNENGKSRWTHHAASRELQVDCFGVGLLRLGQSTGVGYRFRLGITQPGWAGDVGMFFGYHEEMNAGQLWRHFQTIRLARIETKAGPVWELRREIWTVKPAAFGLLEAPVETLAAHAVKPDARGEEILEIEINTFGLVSVRWGATPATELHKPGLSVKLKPKDFHGPFGTLNSGRSALYTNAEYFLYERSSQ